MKYHFFFAIKWLILLPLIVACGQDRANMTSEELALTEPNRFSDDEAKDKFRKPLLILKFLEIKPGDKVVDLFGGGGYYTELLSGLVGKRGTIFIQNHSPFSRAYKKELDARLKNNRLPNVKRIDSDYNDLRLPSDTDLIFISLAFHDIYVKRKDPSKNGNPDLFFSQVFQSLKPGGRLVVIDHSGIIGSENKKTTELHRIDEKWTIKQFEAAGFKFIKQSDALRNPDDTRTSDVWDKKVLNKTDQFVHMYKKP